MSLRVLAALAAFVLLSFACGDDSDDSPADSGVLTLPSTTGSAGWTSAPLPTDPPQGTPPATSHPPASNGPALTTPAIAGEVTLLTPVDKQHALPADYVPPALSAVPGDYLAPGFSPALRQEALDAALQMLGDAFAAGYDIRARSGYRSYSEQEATFQYWINTVGYDEAVRVSAMAGHSEHQLGTAADLTTAEVGWELVESFGATAAGRWLADHAHEYGFAASYPAGAEAITGYTYEPWHFRYIGPEAAAIWRASGLTLNQYLLSLS